MNEHIKGFEALPAHSVIDIGSIVEIYYGNDPDDTETIQIVGWHDEGNTHATDRTVSPGTALGKEIIGKQAGDPVTFKGPTGEIISIRIVSVR